MLVSPGWLVLIHELSPLVALPIIFGDCEHPKKLTLSGVLRFRMIHPYLGHDSWRREFSVDLFNVNV